MPDKLDIQKEILGQMLKYSENLAVGLDVIIKELRDKRKSDTEELLNLIIQGINWEIEVFNCCESLVNQNGVRIVKSKMAEAVVRLGKILKEKDDIKIAACLDVDFVPFVKSMESAGINAVGK